ncbi:MAG: NAD(P)-dependent oxidoreductase [Bacteroidia bacterium]
MMILVTGVNGFIGKALFKSLKIIGEPMGIYNTSDKIFENTYKIDLLKEEEVFKFSENEFAQKIDTIVHLSSRTVNGQSSDDISIIAESAQLSKNLALLCKKTNIKYLINISSSSVYSNTDGTYNENSSTQPASNSDCFYGVSKLNSEIIFDHTLSSSNIMITHLRVCMVLGDNIDKTRLIPVLENEIVNSNTVTLFGNGERIINTISIERLVEYINFFIKNPSPGVFNVAEESISVLELSKRLIAKKGNKETKIILKEQGNKSKFILETKKLHMLLKKIGHV